MSRDPGYGDPNAPVGSEEWAKRWRLGFQSVILDLPKAPERSVRYFELGQEHRAWTLLTDDEGRPYRDFDAFCAYRQPWGLGMEPAKFKAYLEVELGKRTAELVTVAPDGRVSNAADQERGEDGRVLPKANTDSGHSVPNRDGEDKKAKRLRAILRAPEEVQTLYRDGLVSQTTAALMGPQKPTEEQASKVVRAREAIESMPRPDNPAERKQYRKDVDAIIRRTMGRPAPTPLDELRRAWAKASAEDRAAFLGEVMQSDRNGHGAH